MEFFVDNVVELFPAASTATKATATAEQRRLASALAEAAAELARQAAEVAAGRSSSIHPDWVNIVEGCIAEWVELHPDEFPG